MIDDKYFRKFVRERNLKDSTVNNYTSALMKYVEFHGKTLTELLEEAEQEEYDNVPLKNRKLKTRLVRFRNQLFKENKSSNTIKGYMVKVKTFYTHYEITLPNLPDARYKREDKVNYFDLPNHEHIRKALLISDVHFSSVILFMSSSGTARAETLSLTVEDFINATHEYHNGGSINDVLRILEKKRDVVPVWYIHRRKTDKYYYTCSSPESTKALLKSLLARPNLELDTPLFDYTESTLLSKFQEVNDYYDWGFKGKYRFFRSHSLRKFHASNIGLSSELIDALQGRSKNQIHDTYIKTNPRKLKEAYISSMKNILINNDEDKVVKQEFTIVVNVFLSGKEYNIL